MLATAHTCLVRGLAGSLVEVQVDVSAGVPGFALVGLAAAAVREARERVRSAIRNSGLTFPLRRLTVNLAPAELRKEGSGLDLAIAVGIALAAGGRPSPVGIAFVGELALDGAVRHVDGVLVAARALREAGFRELLVAPADAEEAALVGGLTIRACPSLAATMAHLHGGEELPVHAGTLPSPPADPELGDPDDLAEVRGQAAARRALEISAAGAHHLLMSGPPGAGKTMLARCLPGILPPLGLEEALELAQVRSVLGELPEGHPLDWHRPFRAPHHAVSLAGLVGGGSALAAPGEVSRAHHGVLFLDELAEFPSAVLQSLRQPLEMGRVTITRSAGAVTYPCRFLLVAATNPCPCGWLGDPRHPCRCTPAAIDAYRRGLSGPLLDRIDLRVEVGRPEPAVLTDGGSSEPSAAVRARVLAARSRQARRQGPVANAELRAPGLRRHAALGPRPRRALERWAAEGGLSARGLHRAWRVARTIADLEGAVEVGEDHVHEALGYRVADRAA